MNRIPVVGWILSVFLNLSLSIPFWFIWTVCGIGEYFFSNLLPSPFVNPSLWVILGLFICIEILRSLVFPARWGSSNDKDEND